MGLWCRLMYSRAKAASGASAAPGAVAIAQRRSHPAVVLSASAAASCAPLTIWRNAVSEMMAMFAPAAFNSSAFTCFDPFFPCPYSGEPSSPTTK